MPMSKKLDLRKSVFELTCEYPEVAEIMAELGFSEVRKKSVLHSLGKVMTIPKGAKLKHIPMSAIISAFLTKGFELVGEMPEINFTKPETSAASSIENSKSRKETLKSYLKRLGAGESLESVRVDFVQNFHHVDASEIMEAEQELLKEGTPLTEVQRLCDLHSALFHGATTAEKIAQAEQAVEQSLAKKQKQETAAKPQENATNDYAGKTEQAAALARIPGHPLYTFTQENESLTALLQEYRRSTTDAIFQKIREVSIHYAKKGDLLYPNLKVKYDISGPSDVMWTVDDEIRDELKSLAEKTKRDTDWSERMEAVLRRIEEMIYKEQNILFPICAVNFTEEEWFGIYRDSKDYADCFGVSNEVWESAENKQIQQAAHTNGEIVLPGGHLTVEQLTALLNTIPLEISFIDADNINRFFNEGPKVFKRPAMAIDREVFSCHPPKIEPMVRSIINDLRNGVRDSVPVWMDKGGRTMLVTYMAVRDRANKYLGTMEIVQDMEDAKAHFGK